MFIDSFIGFLRVERNYSMHTLRAYAKDIRAFRDFLYSVDGSFSFSDADSDLVRAWAASLMDSGSSPATVCRRLSSLRTFYDYLCREGHVSGNPASAIQGPKRRKRLPAFVKEADMDYLLDEQLPDGSYEACRDRMILMLFYETGIRLSELVGLDVSGVDTQASVIKVFGKRSRERIIPFAGELNRELEHYLAVRSALPSLQCDALFLSSKGNRISHSAVYRMVKTRLGDIGSVKKRSPHVLRHSFATAMLNNGAEIGVVRELLGHKRLATTEIYTHLTFEELKKVYEKAHPRAGVN